MTLLNVRHDGEWDSRPLLYFVTTSEVKFRQYHQIFDELGYDLQWADLNQQFLVEPQVEPTASDNEWLLVEYPLHCISTLMEESRQLPFFVEDTMLLIDAFSRSPHNGSGLPGPDTKNWWYHLGGEGVLRLMNGSKKREARFVCQIGAYLGSGEIHFERAVLQGTIALEARSSPRAEQEFPRSNPYYFHAIFEPLSCHLTLAEMGGDDFSQYDYRRKCAQKFVARLRCR